ncbi:efflux RND transporter periplasmic adaptor subunit [Bergeyella sp. RCAD1439]|uniref:efflux RND transporter periplasmic adaptor subunit n=1 Tax=Bergeyella anatis TaxID=3113737 RepID=UPI002E17FC34|nr:efflux RND transporter periplasmic adaptor subunit [Bergeyella sp. RCAD1439]
MDTKIEKKHSKIKIILIAAGVMIFSTLFLSYFFRQKSTYNVNREELQLADVTFGTFEDVILITAQTQSLNSSLVNVLEGGAVKAIYAEDGQMVTQGQPLARVYNPNTEFGYLNQETGIMQQISQMRNALLELKNQEFHQNKEWLQAQNDYNVALQSFNLQKRLYEAEIGRKTDYDMALQNLNYQQQRKQITEQGLVSEKKARSQQISAINHSISQMQKSLEVLKGNQNNFLILALVSGRLSSFGIAMGQNLTSGESIGKIDLMDGYKLVAKVDEYYINKLQVGLKGTLDSNGTSYAITVSKILPEVKDGRFSAELGFTGAKPSDLKIGMSFGVKIKLSQDTQSLMIPKGNFYNTTGGRWVFVLREGKAVKRNIRLNRENQRYYEVVSGLHPKEKVIVSGYEDFKNYEELIIKD